MSEYPKRLQELIDSLNYLSDQNDRIQFLIEQAEKFSEVQPEIAKRPFGNYNKVDYCESEAYVWTKKLPDDTFKFYFAVENPHGVSAKALAVIIDETLSGETAENILRLNNDLIFEIFGQSLSMGKNMGMTGILSMIKKQVKRLSNNN